MIHLVSWDNLLESMSWSIGVKLSCALCPSPPRCQRTAACKPRRRRLSIANLVPANHGSRFTCAPPRKTPLVSIQRVFTFKMASRSLSPPSSSNSPPASLLIETVDSHTGDALAQSVDQPPRDLHTAVSPLASTQSDHLDHIDIPYDNALAQSVEDPSQGLAHAASPAITDHTVIPHDLAGPARSESGQPPQSPSLAVPPSIIDRIDIPHDSNIPSRLAHRQRPGNLRPAILPALTNYEEQHPFGILNSVHLRLQIGRDTSGDPNMMPPAPPARIVQRNDFKGTPPNGDPKDNITTTTATPAQGASHNDQGADNSLGNAMKQTFPPKLEGVAEARQKSEAKTTEDLAGLGPELEAAVLAKREYNDKFGVFRTRWTKVQFALADRAEKMRGRSPPPSCAPSWRPSAPCSRSARPSTLLPSRAGASGSLTRYVLLLHTPIILNSSSRLDQTGLPSR